MTKTILSEIEASVGRNKPLFLSRLTSTYKLASIDITLVALLKPFPEKLNREKYACNAPDAFSL